MYKNEEAAIQGKVNSLINSVIKSISKSGICEFEVVCNDKIIHEEVRKKVADLTMDVISTMPKNVKHFMFDHTYKILEFNMITINDTYKFSVKTPEPTHVKFEDDIQEILDDLQTDFEKDFLK